MTRVSSLSSAPVSVLVPSANAAQTRARLVTLLEPGGRVLPRMGRETDSIAIEDCSDTLRFTLTSEDKVGTLIYTNRRY